MSDDEQRERDKMLRAFVDWYDRSWNRGAVWSATGKCWLRCKAVKSGWIELDERSESTAPVAVKS